MEVISVVSVLPGCCRLAGSGVGGGLTGGLLLFRLMRGVCMTAGLHTHCSLCERQLSVKTRLAFVGIPRGSLPPFLFFPSLPLFFFPPTDSVDSYAVRGQLAWLPSSLQLIQCLICLCLRLLPLVPSAMM